MILIKVGQTLEEVEQILILETLCACDWNKTKTAKVLNIGIRTLYRKLKKYKISNRGE